MRIALVHDYLCGVGGAERVFQYICEAFPDADIFTLAFNATATLPYFSKRKIQATWLNPIVQSMDAFRLAFPLATYVMESVRLRSYDVVLSSSATVAKYVNVSGCPHVCYCYIPTRAIWQSDDYFRGGTIAGHVFKAILPYLKQRDLDAANRVTEFIAISEDSRQHIQRSYGRDAAVIHCPIDLDAFYSSYSRADYFLLVSRLEHWKRVDYAIEAFNRLGLPLHIIGTGSEQETLKAMAGPSIKFLGAVDDRTLAEEYSRAKAVVFTPFLEYGLIPLEANASGAPVICFGKGGVTETLIPALGPDGSHATAIFFQEQSAEALIAAVQRFAETSFDIDFMTNHARQWGIPEFQRKLRRQLGLDGVSDDAVSTADPIASAAGN